MCEAFVRASDVYILDSIADGLVASVPFGKGEQAMCETSVEAGSRGVSRSDLQRWEGLGPVRATR